MQEQHFLAQVEKRKRERESATIAKEVQQFLPYTVPVLEKGQ